MDEVEAMPAELPEHDAARYGHQYSSAGVRVVSLADAVGVATRDKSAGPGGLLLHEALLLLVDRLAALSRPAQWYELRAGCRPGAVDEGRRWPRLTCGFVDLNNLDSGHVGNGAALAWLRDVVAPHLARGADLQHCGPMLGLPADVVRQVLGLDGVASSLAPAEDAATHAPAAAAGQVVQLRDAKGLASAPWPAARLVARLAELRHLQAPRQALMREAGLWDGNKASLKAASKRLERAMKPKQGPVSDPGTGVMAFMAAQATGKRKG